MFQPSARVVDDRREPLQRPRRPQPVDPPLHGRRRELHPARRCPRTFADHPRSAAKESCGQWRPFAGFLRIETPKSDIDASRGRPLYAFELALAATLAPPKAPASSSTSRTPRRGRSAPRSPARFSPRHPDDSSLARAADALTEREFEVAAHTDRSARPARRSPTPPCSSSPTPPTRSGRRPWTAARPCSTRRRDRGDRGVRPRRRRADRARRDRAGQVRQQPQPPARPLRHRDRAADRPGLRAPSRRRPILDPRLTRRPSRHPRNSPPAPTRSPASSAACFYRAGVLEHAKRRPRDRPLAADRFGPERTARRRRSSTAPGRVVVTRRLRPLRRRLHRRPRPRGPLAQPRLLGGPARVRRPPTPSPLRRPPVDPAWTAAQGRGRGAPPRPRRPTARSTPPSTTPHQLARSRRADRRVRQALKPPLPPPARLHRRPRAPTLLAWADAGYPKPAFDRSIEAFRPERDRRDGIEHLVVFPMYKQNASRDTCFEALIVRVPWPEWIAELERTRLRQRQVPPGHLRRLHVRLRLRVRRPLPGDLLDRRAPLRLSLRRDLLRPRGRALPPRLRRRCGHPPPQPPARRRLPALLAASSPVAPTCSGTSSTTAPTCAATCPSTRS